MQGRGSGSPPSPVPPPYSQVRSSDGIPSSPRDSDTAPSHGHGNPPRSCARGHALPRAQDVLWVPLCHPEPVLCPPPQSQAPPGQHSRWMTMPSRRAMRKRRMMLIRATHSQVNLQSARNLQPTCPQSCWPRGEDSGQSQTPTSLHGLARPHPVPMCPQGVPEPTTLSCSPMDAQGAVYKPPGWYRGHPGVVLGQSHPCLAPRSVPPGAPRPQKRGCRTRSVGQRVRLAPWGPVGTTSSTHTPSPTLLPSRASGQSVISVKSFMAAGGSRRSLAKILPSALCPPAPPPCPPQLPPWVSGRRGDPCSPLRGEGGGNASSTRGSPAAEPSRGPCPPCRVCGEPRQAAVPCAGPFPLAPLIQLS